MNNTTTMYGIAIRDEDGNFGFTNGPTLYLNDLLISCGEKNSIIFELCDRGEHLMLYKWNDETDKWEKA